MPLVAHGRILGVVTFVWVETERRYGEADLPEALALARCAALAADNARLHCEAEAALEALGYGVARRRVVRRAQRPF